MVTRKVAGVILVNDEGLVLLQLRDGSAPVAPNKWSLVGGHLEPGEDPEVGARRELEEETALTAGDLSLAFHETTTSADGLAQTEWWVYCGRTAATKADIVVGEGADITFVDPAVALTLDLAIPAAIFLPRFLSPK
jgi:8-oxo-dGTP diphosphatase